MRTMDLQKQQMFMRVRDFGAARLDLFPNVSRAGKLFAAVAAAADTLAQQLPALAGPGGVPPDTITSKAIARKALRQRLVTIATMARALELETPGFAANFRLPLDGGNPRLLVVARSFARDAQPLAGVFIAHDMPSNFLAALAEDTDALAGAMQQTSAGRVKWRAVRAGIDATIAAADRAVRQLHAIVLARLPDDGAARASWNTARRVDRAPRSKRPKPAQVAPAPVNRPEHDVPAAPASSASAMPV